MKPRIVNNDFAQAVRFPDASVFGTGSKTQSTENDGINGLLEVDSGSAGRAWNSAAFTLVAGQWYCFSFEMTANSGLTTGTDRKSVG